MKCDLCINEMKEICKRHNGHTKSFKCFKCGHMVEVTE